MKWFDKLFLALIVVCAVSNSVYGRGTLWVNCGPMWGGKTTGLIEQLDKSEQDGKSIIAFKHYWDKRKSGNIPVLWTHTGQTRPACRIGEDMPEDEQDVVPLGQVFQVADKYNVIGIDEVQFFSLKIVDIINQLLEHDKDVIVAGLDLDFRCEPFGQTMPKLMQMANVVTVFAAKCQVPMCGASAPYTQRLINGEPAKYDSPLILVGDKECYEPRCAKHHVIDYSKE